MSLSTRAEPHHYITWKRILNDIILHLEAGWVFIEQLTTLVLADVSGEVVVLCTKLQGLIYSMALPTYDVSIISVLL